MKDNGTGLTAILFFALLSSTYAVLAHDSATRTIPLLAVTEDGDGENSTGALAELRLELRPGEGHVFLETIPLARAETQVSMRFSQQIACNYLDIDCSSTDFLYTIVAPPGIVGGPSAGAAATVLTAASLQGLSLDNDVAITGTINSGGLIGPVGGIDKKIEAAAEHGYTKVLIPAGTAQFKEQGDAIDLIALGEKQGVEVVEVATIDDALAYFSGTIPKNISVEIAPAPEFIALMRNVAGTLCDRAKGGYRAAATLKNETRDLTLNLTIAADRLFSEGKYYTAASYCFRTSVIIHSEQERARNETRGAFMSAIDTIARNINATEAQVDNLTIATIQDLQTFMLVKERLLDARESLTIAADPDKEPEDRLTQKAYAEERLFSARTWMQFFGGKDKLYDIDEKTLEDSCAAKIAEAEERYTYVRGAFGENLEEARKSIDRAEELQEQEKYEFCLFKASIAKAEADIVLSAVGIEEKDVEAVIERKLAAAKVAIARAQRKGIQPIIGLSYYEYASDLKEKDPYASLLFAEYAIELSNLDTYFPPKMERPAFSSLKLFVDNGRVPFEWVFLAFIVGAIAGVGVMKRIRR